MESPFGASILLLEAMTMIRNLNQMTFQEFGTILPEKAQSGRPLDKGIELEMKQGEAPVFRASSETWICGGNGMSVLSLSKDGENFQHSIWIRPSASRIR